jgi:hypothetical protein
VVDQQELHVALLGLVGNRRRMLAAHHHAGCNRQRARGLRLWHRPTIACVRDLDQALPARTDGVQQRVIAKARDLYADLLSSANHQGAFGHGDLDIVDGQRHRLGSLARGTRRSFSRLDVGRHAVTPENSDEAS